MARKSWHNLARAIREVAQNAKRILDLPLRTDWNLLCEVAAQKTSVLAKTVIRKHLNISSKRTFGLCCHDAGTSQLKSFLGNVIALMLSWQESPNLILDSETGDGGGGQRMVPRPKW